MFHLNLLYSRSMILTQRLLTMGAWIVASSAVLLFSACDQRETKTMEVTATAYNSLAAQTDHHNPSLAAWGDTLSAGMKVIAVSRDLIDSGLTHNTEVRIEGLPGTYIVKDKMNRRWRKKIDIYMGLDVDTARSWGKRKVEISWKMDTPE